jgi:hypothetical protein
VRPPPRRTHDCRAGLLTPRARRRPQAEAAALDAHLKGLGAEHVFTYGQLDDRAFVRRVGEITGGAVRPTRLSTGRRHVG